MKIQSTKQKQIVFGSFIVLECALWGLGNVITKIALESITPFFCLAIKFLVAFLIFALMFRSSAFKGMTKEQFKSCLIIGAFTAFFFIFGTLALFMTTATAAGFFMSVAVLFTPFLSAIVLKKKIDKKIFPVILIVVVGAYFLCVNSGTFTFGTGEVLALLCSLTLALQLIFTSKHVENVGIKMLSTMQCGVAAVICFIFAFIFEAPSALADVTLVGWGGVLYLAIGCTVISYLLQNVALEKITPIFASLAFTTEPVFTAICAYFMLGEVLSRSGIIGCVLIMIGLVIASLINEKDSENSDKNKDSSQESIGS